MRYLITIKTEDKEIQEIFTDNPSVETYLDLDTGFFTDIYHRKYKVQLSKLISVHIEVFRSVD